MPLSRFSPILHVVSRLENGAEAVVVGLWDRIVAMVVALCTADGEAEEGGADDLDRLGHDVVASGGLLDAAVGGAVRGHSHKACCGEQVGLIGREVFEGRSEEFVTRELLCQKLVPRLI